MRPLWVSLLIFLCLASCHELANRIVGVRGSKFQANLEIVPEPGVRFTTQTSLLRKRVMSAYLADGEEVSEGGKLYSIQVNGVGDSNCLKLLLQTKGQLAVYHTFEFSELADYINAIHQLSIESNKTDLVPTKSSAKDFLTEDEIMEKLSNQNHPDGVSNSLFAYMSIPFTPNGQVEGAVCGYALQKDTSTVIKILHTYAGTAKLPGNLMWYWGAFSYSADTIFALYAIQTPFSSTVPLFTNQQVVEAWADEQKDKESVLYSVILHLDGAGSSAFHKATSEAANAMVKGQRTHKSLAVILDGSVYSCPRVMQEISGGRLSITGIKTYEEAKVLSSIITNAPLAARVNLLSLLSK